MSYNKSQHAPKASGAIVAALVLALTATPLVACGARPAAEDGGTTATATATQTTTVDPSSWKTLGDAIATQTESMASSWDSEHLVTMFKAGDSYVRVVAQLNEEESKKIDAIDWSSDDVADQIAKAAGTATIVSAEDVTSEIVSPDELAKLVGKTGKELLDDGWVFDNYFMYGGDETGATMAKGNFAYSVTFACTTPESATNDGGASIMDAAVVEANLSGASNAATDPNSIG